MIFFALKLNTASSSSKHEDLHFKCVAEKSMKSSTRDHVIQDNDSVERE